MSTPQALADHYIAAWNETDADARRALIARTWAEDATYVDPVMAGRCFILAEQLHRADAIPSERGEQIERLDRRRAEPGRKPATDGIAVGQQIVEVVIHARAAQRRVADPER